MRNPICPIACAAALSFASLARAESRPPNVVIILADDLGFGDVSCNGATKIRTPHIDRLADQGLRFTDAHAAAATCTPSRFALLTGQYAWRQAGTNVLPGNATLIIPPGRPTLASMFQKAGYKTGAVGKWHLGLGEGKVDWNTDIRPGPLDIGFDYCFLIPATGDRVPCVYVENRRVVGLDPKDPIEVSYDKPIGDEPTGKKNPELLKMHPSYGHDMTIVNGISRIGFMTGGKAARWVDEDMADVITGKAVDFIEKHQREPFFLYFATHDIHVPRVPHQRFAGRSGMGPRGDVILEFDWSVGRITETLERLKLADNTLVIVTSDNGPVIDDGYQDDAVAKLGGHTPSGPFRGNKYSAYEAGTRVPFVVRWPARIKPGTSDALLCQVDFMASFAALTAQKLPEGAAPDSENILPALLGESRKGRELLVEQAAPLSLRAGLWKYIEARNGPRMQKLSNVELGNAPEPQLYDLSSDLAEQTNLADKHPERAGQMRETLKRIRGD